MTSPVPVGHACTLEHSYQDGTLWKCGCGTFWAPVRGKLLNIRTVSPGLLRRLDDYREAIRWKEYASLADAVKSDAAHYRMSREVARVRALARRQRRQAEKRAKGRRIVREMILSRPCAYCGGEAAHVDHVVPVALGGTDAMRNLAAACARCNIEKGGRTPEQWKAWRLARGRSWPPVTVPARA